MFLFVLPRNTKVPAKSEVDMKKTGLGPLIIYLLVPTKNVEWLL